MTKIRIDRSTFRDNPRAGDTQSRALGAKYATVIYGFNGSKFKFIASGPFEYGYDPKFIEGQLICTERELEITKDAVIPPDFEVGESSHRRFHELELTDHENFEFSVERDVTEYRHYPLPKWLFDYEDAEVQCGSCGAVFSWRDLESDSINDGHGGEVWSDNVCPHCDSWHCCDVEFERPEDVARELGFDQRPIP